MGWYADLKIRNKLVIGFGVVLFGSCLLGYYGITSLATMNQLLTTMYHDNMAPAIEIAEARRHAFGRHNGLYDFVLEQDKAKMDVIREKMDQNQARMMSLLDRHRKTEMTNAEQRLHNRFDAAWQTYLASEAHAITLGYKNDDKGALDILHGETGPAFDAAVSVLNELIEEQKIDSKKEDDAGDAIYTRIRISMAGLVIVSIGFGMLIALSITRSIVGPLHQVKEYATKLTSGNEDKVRILEAIAAGDLSLEPRPAERLQIDRGTLSRDEVGELLSAVVQTSDMQAALDAVFSKMTASLRESREQERGQDWLKSGINELNTVMRGDKPLDQMANDSLAFLTPYIKAGVAAIYLFEEQTGNLRNIANYAFTPRKGPNDTISLGEGLAGEAARQRKPICLSAIPPDYMAIGSALGEAVPRAVLALPLLHDDRLVGVMELGAFSDYTDLQIDFLRQAAGALAIAISVSRSRARIDELLEQTQQQTEELRVQQEELQQTNEELEERAEMLEQQRRQIEMKNAEIERTSEELKQKAADLEKVSSYKSEFMANMSHELRTPLNSMMLLSGLLIENRDETLTDKQKEFAATINSSGKDLLNLINDILDLSKVEAGRLELHYESVEVKELCETLESVFGPQAVQKGLAFSITIDANMPETICIDEQRTLQVMKNLLSNAIKFTEQGSVSLRLSSVAGTAGPLGAPSLAFCVADTGIGIPEEKHELVFQAFQQADGSTSRKFGGTGLGLSISLQLARRMGGDITLESEKGKGSVFTLYLPLSGKAGETKRPESPAIKVSPPIETQPIQAGPLSETVSGVSEIPRPLPDDRDRIKPGDRSILVVEDDLNFAGTLMAMVREKGFGCIVAADGTSAIHLADLVQPSAVILDVMLPGVDGWNVMRSLKDNPRTRHVPVHFITCLDDRLRAMSMGAVGFLTKPVSPAQLEALFDTLETAIAKEIKKLLIIEDDKTEAEGMAGLLQSRNCAISIAPTGKEAIELLGREHIDCIVLDLGLCDMSGFDLLEHIHQSEDLRSIPVIIHTGRELTHEEEMKLQRYAKSIIIKGAKSPERLLNEVTLFLHMVESELPAEKRKMIRTALDREAMLEGKKVLLVDDDMRNVFSLSSVLTDKSMVVIEAENGREALARIEEHPDLNIILMDIMMPDMDGYEAIRRIRRDPRHKDIPVIAMTAKALKGDQEKCLAAGANDYISKPLDVEKLLSLLRVWLYRQA